MRDTKFTPGPWKKQTPLFVVQGEEVTHTVEGPPSDFMFLQNEADATLIAAAPDLYEALECAEDAETIRHVIVLGDEFHAICDKWRSRAEELLSDRYPMNERFPGWVGSAMRELSQEMRKAALAKYQKGQG